MRLALLFSIAVWTMLAYFAFSFNSEAKDKCMQQHDIATCYQAYK